MDDDKLLQRVINLHYHTRPKIVTDAMQLIQDYCSKEQTDSEYDKVLQTLHDLMNDLPSNILLYFLTTVPMPKHKGNTVSVFSELMKKSRITLLDNIKPVLTEYLNNAVPPLVAINSDNADKENTVKHESADIKHPETEVKQFSKLKDNRTHTIKTASVKKGIKVETSGKLNCKSLLDICAEYVVCNLTHLQNYYQDKNKVIWNLLNTKPFGDNELTSCYKYIEDLNRKLQLLRSINAGHVPLHIIEETYSGSEILLREQNLGNIVEDAFTISSDLDEMIRDVVYN